MANRRRLCLVADLDDDDDLDFGHDRRLCKRRNRGSLQQDRSTQLWSERYRPRRSRDLCVSNKKANELRTWLNEGSGVLVCIGPPGAGKSTALEVLAAELGYHLVQWSDPITLSSHYSSIRDQTAGWTGDYQPVQLFLAF
ncbi:hypothetical protein BVRB_033540 [Beta vulgaris subsp. vulgaris]|uniref:ATPase AAA-type core domain-containing protein n=1 Tax=Beta vulgaris subsp. vulgaris TaxID=3555 RepID=A0A0J8AHE5_BETVV|nr:hypothetical protein BVRB_033540 [Beta vulgaris subsp. vulgaris]